MIKLAIKICDRSNYKDFITPQHLVLSITEGIDDRCVKVYRSLLITELIKSYVGNGCGDLEYTTELIKDFLRTSECKAGLRILRDMSINNDIILICDDFGDVSFSKIVTDEIKKLGGIVENYGGR